MTQNLKPDTAEFPWHHQTHAEPQQLQLQGGGQLCQLMDNVEGDSSPERLRVPMEMLGRALAVELATYELQKLPSSSTGPTMSFAGAPTRGNRHTRWSAASCGTGPPGAAAWRLHR